MDKDYIFVYVTIRVYDLGSAMGHGRHMLRVA